ncbi:hypothetical protein [Nocardia terpenica]|uniref:Uncharacterized protein n=1 Tax=Nocardia terpenica TaxID=455432 RepID=A0A291RYV8_9NOCA|nr:hypothetical protein [Nocardia terpenica]ATL72510.1 hypothetical protein CRH09_39750 [Nocardia terpenica]
MGFLPIDPARPFADHIEQSLTTLADQLGAAGHALGDAQITMNLTDRTDDDIRTAQRCAAAHGLTGVLFVDDSRPARPGTVPSNVLGPDAAAVAAEARAHRILGR